MDVETTYRGFTSPFDYPYSSVAAAAAAATGNNGSRLLDFTPDTLSSIWTSVADSSGSSNSSKEANHYELSACSSSSSGSTKDPSLSGSGNSQSTSPSPPALSLADYTGGKEDKQPMTTTMTGGGTTANGTGRESSTPPNSAGTGSLSSVSSSLETSNLDNLASASIFGDSVWSSKGSFTDLGSFGSTEEERRFLAESKSGGAGYLLKPPATSSAPGSHSSATWGSFWSDLSPSLSPSNSETNLQQHFGTSPAPPHNPFATWTANAAMAANRRSAPSNSSPFSSGSVSPISRRQLSPNVASATSGVSPQQQQQQQSAYRHVQHVPAGYQNAGAGNHAGTSRHHQQYRRSISHPNNGPLLHHHQHHQQQQQQHNQANQYQYYTTMSQNGFDGAFYTHQQQNGLTETGFSCSGWNMEPATGAGAGSINGYNQDTRTFQSPGGTTTINNGMDIMKYCFDPLMNDAMRGNYWDDSGKGKNFFGSYASYDGSPNNGGYSDPLLDPFDQMVPVSISPMGSRMSPRNQSSSSEFGGDQMHVFSRKVFVGGLPPDIDEEEITASFRRFGPLIVDWPHKAESKSYFPPKGYAFLLFQDESSVQTLMDASVQEGDKTYFYVSSPTNKDKPVQVRPWRLTDNEYYLDAQSKLDPRLTVFVGGVPRPLRAQELAVLMNQRFGYVAYAGIDVDSELKYPKGAGRITFSNQQSYIAAINARFVQLQNGEIDKRVELKPYVLDDQICDYCHGMKCSGRSAPLFCSQVGCLAYLCEHCWTPYHSSPGKEHHKPVTKESSVDRSRPAAMRW